MLGGVAKLDLKGNCLGGSSSNPGKRRQTLKKSSSSEHGEKRIEAKEV